MQIKQATQQKLMTSLLCTVLSCSAASAVAAQKPQADTADRKAKTVASQTKQDSKQQAVKGLSHQGNNKQSKKSADGQSAVATSARNSLDHIWIYSVDITMEEDPNHNGFYNRVIVDFDVDTIYDHEKLYAVLSLTDPDGQSFDYFVTDDFNIYGESEDDSYQVDTLLTNNWPADYYDLSIHIYDAYSHDEVAYVDKYDAEQMANLTLESLDYEYANPQYLSVFKTELLLLRDLDGDGFYRDFNLELDVDVNFGQRDVYAEIYSSDDDYHWQHLYTSDVFRLDGSSILDAQQWHIELLSGYGRDYYDLKIKIVDADEHKTLLNILPEYQSALYQVPLEDTGADGYSAGGSVPPSDDSIRTSVSSESGGSFGGLFTLLLLTAGILRRKA